MSFFCSLVLTTCLTVGAGSTDVSLREKRSDRDKRGFTPDEKDELVSQHNKYRSQEPATDMLYMEWDNELETVAQSWAERCIWTHSNYAPYKIEKFRYIGENLFAFTETPTPTKVVTDWANEKQFYDYNTGRCTKVCGHYTQVVWSSSYTVGCGVSFCPSIQNLNWERYGGGYVVVCNYGPGGNIIGRKPFSQGQPQCSECPTDFPYCVQGLCSRTERITSSGVAVATSPLLVILTILLYFVMS